VSRRRGARILQEAVPLSGGRSAAEVWLEFVGGHNGVAQVLDGLIDGSTLRHHCNFKALTDESRLIRTADSGGDVLAQIRHRFPRDNPSPHVDRTDTDSHEGRGATQRGGGNGTGVS